MLLIGSLLSIVTGLALGSFMMVLIPRLYHQRKGILFGRSHCQNCQHELGVLDLIPVVSYFLLWGKCRYCAREISAIYPVVEVVMALTFFVLFITSAKTLLASGTIITTTLFILLGFHLFVLLFTFFYDLLYYEISDLILIPAIGIAFIQTFLPQTIFPETADAVIGAAIPLSIFLIQIVISRGKWLGLGDLRIGAYMGLLLGAEKTIIGLILTYSIGALVAGILLATKQATKKTPIPFGPFLVSGTLIALFLGNMILDWYYHRLLLIL